MKKEFLILFGIILMIMQISLVSASTYEANYSSGKITPKDATFMIQILKYEPFPVNPGDWFDLWVKVQNVGQDDAKNARFELIPSYPFSSNDSLVREYGIIPGVASAYRNKDLSDVDIEINQVIMKFRVKVAEDAPEGKSTIQLQAKTNGDSGQESSYNLPIEIEKTKTNFEIVMQDSTAQGTSFAIANIGDKPATAVIVSIPEQPGITVKGARSSILGNLDKGDFTTVTFQLTPQKDVKDLTIEISYTDDAGIRNTVEKKVYVDFTSQTGTQTTTAGTNFRQNTTKSLPSFVYIILGIVIGVVGLIITRKIIRRKK